MRGRNYNAGSRRLVGGSTLGIALIVIVLAIALIFLLLLYLPLTDSDNTAGIFGKGKETDWNKIVSISYAEKEVGVGSEKDKIYLTVTYDNGETEDVALSQMVCAGLDVTSSGTQNVSLSYGGFEQTIPITVKDIDCVLTYTSSDGGRVQGEKKQSIVSGQDASTVVAIPETGYTFVEWNDGYPYATRKDRNVNETREYKAIFEKTQFVVFFFYDDGTVAREETVLYGEAATDIPKMSDPRMAVYGKTFQGWSVNEEDYKCVIRDMSIYPQYVKTATDVNMTVSSDQYGKHMGETDANECGYYEHNSTGVITATPYNSREFDSWEVWGYETATSDVPEWIRVEKKLTGESTTRVYIGDNRELCVFTSNSTGNAGSQYALSFTPNEYMDNIELRANFVYSNSTVTFINYQNSVKNNQECVIADIPFGTTIGEALADVYVTEDGAKLNADANGMLLPEEVYGYAFLGWYDKLDEEQKIVSIHKTFTEPTSLIAKWEKLKYNVIFNYDTADNSDVTYDIDVYFQGTIGSGGGVPYMAPYRDKYNFIGWEDALTHELVDDSTQIIAKKQYLTANSNFEEGRIYMAPRWEAKEHVLKVDSKGSGSVALRIHPLVGADEEVSISGEYIIYETYTYELVFRADNDFYVESYTSQLDNGIPTYITSTSGLVSPVVSPTGDNYFLVVFAPIVYTATIHNGDAVYRGYVEGVPGGSENTSMLSFNSGETVSFNIISSNEAYEISEIRLTGKASGVNYIDELIEKGLSGSGTTQYRVILEKCISDLDITVKYSTINYMVSIRQPENGMIETTVFNGAASDFEEAPTQKNYLPGDRLFYAITADDGSGDYYINEVRLNGVRYDLFSTVVSDSGMEVVFYDWEISGRSYGITLKYIDGKYYYSFGIARYEDNDYMYCQNVTDSSDVAIFLVEDVENERYVPLDAQGAANAPVSPAYYEALYTFLREELEVDKKGIGNASLGKDNRVTAVKVMILLNEAITFSVSTDHIYYTVSVAQNDLATSSVQNSEDFSSSTELYVQPGKTVFVKTKAITGYKVVGYYKNYSETLIPVESAPGETFNTGAITVNEDIHIEFAYEIISFRGTFSANENDSVVVSMEDGTDPRVLSNSYTYTDFRYASKATFLITVKEGKSLYLIVVNDTFYYPIMNMTSYLLVLDSIKEDISVSISCMNADGTEPVSSGYAVQLNTESSHAMASVKYGATDNSLTILAEEGYTLSGVTIRGAKDGVEKQININPALTEKVVSDTTGSGIGDGNFAYISDDARYDDYKTFTKAFVLTLPATGIFDEVAYVDIRTTPIVCTITIEDMENGKIDNVSPTADYGETLQVTVSASAYYYIESFIVNGVTIPFGSSDWERLNYVSSVRHYNNGEYNLLVSGDTTLKAVFRQYSYTVKVDKESVNGVTDISVKDGLMEEDGKVAHGKSIIISMKANQGYHIQGILINNVKVEDYVLSGGAENNNVIDSYTYNGPEGIGITQNVSVRVLYEINRYSFHYTIVNDSANFAGTAGAGVLTSTYTPVSGSASYTGIAYGDNFSVLVTPAISSGYYLYSMSITYKGINDAVAVTKTRYHYDKDGIISKSGGTIWFNLFWFSGSVALATGVTADIEEITVTFKRETYSVSFMQNSIGGTMEVSFLNPSARSSDEVIIFGQKKGDDDAEMTTFYYNDGLFLTSSSDRSSDSGIRLRYESGSSGAMVFSDGNDEYELYFEYGIRCVVSSLPHDGYDRKTFVVDSEDKMDLVSDNKYNFNFYRSSQVETSFVKQVFKIEIKCVINVGDQKVDSKDGTVTDYIDVKLKYNGNESKLTAYELVKSVNLEYGTTIAIDFKSLFDNKGVYLDSLKKTVVGRDGLASVPEDVKLNLAENSLLSACNVKGVVTFTGGTGYFVKENLILEAFFKISRYDISTSISYDEELKTETKNQIGQKTSINKTKWSVLWGESADVGLKIDSGYELDRIIITYPQKTVIIRTTDDNTDTAIYEPTTEGNNATNNLNLLTLSSVKEQISVVVVLKRRSYSVIYDVDNVSFIRSLTTYYNENNTTYPKDTRVWNKRFTEDVRYYDELRVVVMPEDGYEITAQKITIYRAEKENETWQKMNIITTLNFERPVSGEETKQFIVNQMNVQDNAKYITGDTYVEISVTIKRYNLTSTVLRTNAAADSSSEKNNTEVSLKIFVDAQNNNYLEVNGSRQLERKITKDSDAEVASVAQHNSEVIYEFVTPEGYKLGGFNVNGRDLDALIDGHYATYTASKYAYNSKCYHYKITLIVTTSLVKGPTQSSSNVISVKMDIIPITYDVVIMIDNDIKMFETYNGRNSVTDGERLRVYSAKNVVHFSSINIEPSLFEGYQIDETDAYVGLGGGLSAESYVANFGAEQKDITVRRSFVFDASTLPDADVTADRTVVYFTFKASIIKYSFKISSVVYYSQDGECREAGLSEYNTGHVAYQAGHVEYIKDYNNNFDPTDASGGVDETLDYFTEISVSGVSYPGFSIFAVYEKVNNVWQPVKESTNGIRYLIVDSDSYEFAFMIDGTGDREFRLDFKERTTITINITNPYKYYLGESIYYAQLEAFESDVESERGTYLKPRDPENPQEKVRTTYVYEVYVGNYFFIKYTDAYRSSSNSNIDFSVYSIDLKDIAIDCIDNGDFDVASYQARYNAEAGEYLVNGMAVSNDKEERFRIRKTGQYYLYDNDVYAHVQTSKTTYDATRSANGNSVGGNVYYNNNKAESRDNVFHEDSVNKTTKEGHLFTVVCEPKDYYVFYRLRLKQMDVSAGKREGKLVYTDDFESIIYYENVNEAVSRFNDRNQNGCVLLNFRQEKDAKTQKTKYLFTFWMNGDMELEVEYYRTYNIHYARYLPDVIADGGQPTKGDVIATDNRDTVFTVNNVGPFAAASGAESVTISYGSGFSLRVTPPQQSYYVFVGWYINDLNLYEYLESMTPDADYYVRDFTVDYLNMPSLIDEDGSEVYDIVIYARFEPIIDVRLVNEKFYAYDNHFNSWDMGILNAIYYDYDRTDNNGISGDTVSVLINDEQGKKISEALSDVELLKSANGWSEKWSELLLKKTLLNGYADKYYVHTATKTFSVLYDNITDSDFLTNSWKTSYIELHMTPSFSDIAFSSWQYFNWNTEQWEEIKYEYLSEDGYSDYWIGSDSSEYILSLSALYDVELDENDEKVVDSDGLFRYKMPYALSATSKGNMGSDADRRPLLIRPNVYKFFTVSLQQFAFSALDESRSYEKGLDSEDASELSYEIVYPSIADIIASDDNYYDRNETDDGLTRGTYEYGTTLKLLYNTDDIGGEIYTDSMRYRFIGWHTKIDLKNNQPAVTYYLEGSDSDTEEPFSYQLICAPTYSDTTLVLKAYYVAQYKQVFYSYNISGDAQKKYSTAAKTLSGKAAPQIMITSNATSQMLTFNSIAMNGNSLKFDYSGGSWSADISSTRRTDYYQVTSVDLTQASTNGVAFSSGKDWAFEYYIDAGLEYSVHVYKSQAVDSEDAIKTNSAAKNGFNPAFDTLYILKDGKTVNTQKAEQDLSSYYRTGNATYWDNSKGAVTPAYMTKLALNNIEGWSAEGQDSVKTYRSTSTRQLDLQYVSTTTLIFYNMMYDSGITLMNSSYIDHLTGGQKDTLTVWDTDTKYGDWQNENKADTPTYITQPNGEVVIRVTLIGNSSSNGYKSTVLYALHGMKEGYGIEAKPEITNRNSSALFAPSVSGYGRWIEYDLNQFFGTSNTDISNTRLFGAGGFMDNTYAHNNVARSMTAKIGKHDATPDCYNIEYCGNGTENKPYHVLIKLTGSNSTNYTDNTQLIFLDTFWKNNGYSCNNGNKDGGGNPVRTYFKLYGDNTSIINLQNVAVNRGANSNPQGSSAYIWQPICGTSASDDDDTIKGFDGEINFSGFTVHALAVGPNASYNDKYYGLFGKVCGGKIMNLKFRNGFFQNAQTMVEYLGLVCGYAQNANFTDIDFELNDTSNPYRGMQSFVNSTGNAHIYLMGPAYIGVLFGYGKKSSCDDVVINSTLAGNRYIEISAEQYGGALIGAIEGGNISNVTVQGSTWLVSGVEDIADGAAGGLIGYAGGSLKFLNREIQVDGLDGSLAVSSLSLEGTPTIIVGTENSTISGGLIGVIGKAATVSGIKMITNYASGATNNIAFTVNEDTNEATAGNIMLRAGYKSLSSSEMKSLTKYGFVGAVAGANYGTISGANTTIKSSVFTYSGTAGGIVGANFGTVSNLSLGENFRLYAWEPGNTVNSFNYGGIVGYNFSGSAATMRYVKNGEVASASLTFSGLINDCKLTGADQGTAYTDVAGWNRASVYVFTRSSVSDNTFNSGNKFITTPSVVGDKSNGNYSAVTNSGNYEKSQNYMRMGGICGYSSGRIYNCVVNGARLATYRWRYSYNTSPALGGYAWAVQAGMVCGYFDPDALIVNGWKTYLVDEDPNFSTSSSKYSEFLNNSRIQSCVVNNCSININGNVWMDDMWDASSAGDDLSLAAGVSCAGIVGGTSSRAVVNSDPSLYFAVNTCKVTNMRFYVNFQAYGRQDTGSGGGKGYGWKFWSTSYQKWKAWPPGKYTVTNYWAICIRTYCIIEASVNGIASGLTTPVSGVADTAKANYSTFSGISKTYTESKYLSNGSTKDLGESSQWFGLGDASSGDIGAAWVRYILYDGDVKGRFDAGKQYSGNIRNDTVVTNEIINVPDSTVKFSYGFFKKDGDMKVVRTDPNTGLLECVYNEGFYGYKNPGIGSTTWTISQAAPKSTYVPAIVE